MQQQLCVCILLTWVSTDLIGVGVQSFGELSFGMIVSGADGCIFKGGRGTNSRGSTNSWGSTSLWEIW